MAPPRPAPAAPGEALLTAPRSPVPKRAGRRSLICFKYVSHMIDPAHGDRHRRWPESQEGATPALPGPLAHTAPGASAMLSLLFARPWSELPSSGPPTSGTQSLRSPKHQTRALGSTLY